MDIIGMACKALKELFDNLMLVLPLEDVTEVVRKFSRAIEEFENGKASIEQWRMVRFLVPESDPLILVCVR